MKRPRREILTLVAPGPARRAAERLFRRERQRIARRIPHAEILHIGATAVRGLPTKGDLDIVVRVDAAEFERAERALSSLYVRNLGSDRNHFFAAFKDDAASPPLGVQLVVRGSEHDDFHSTRDLIATSPLLRRALALLKRRHRGRSMDRYRAAKAQFIASMRQREALSSLAMPSKQQTN
jgi:GrpB-like predicted nucleotidyltransferase (UPF0157 family)